MNAVSAVEPLTVIQVMEGAVCRIELKRPKKLNALNLDALEHLLEALEMAQASKEVRVIVLTGIGRAFCVGADLQEAATFRGTAKENVLETHYRPIVERICGMPKPVVAAVNGVASGAGTALALAADVVLVAKSAAFKFPFSSLGLTPDAGSTWLLPKLIGEVRAKNLFMTAGTMTAEQAYAWGAATEIVEDDQLQNRANELARLLSKGAPLALAGIKSLVQASHLNDLGGQLKLEEATQARLLKTNDVMVGVMSFLSKTSPEFKGT
jgi:2-(1,2-epoxy-1,2-dihydrophenyl)acetyl-CoA isomerase